jgi:hypothetical protein
MPHFTDENIEAQRSTSSEKTMKFWSLVDLRRFLEVSSLADPRKLSLMSSVLNVNPRVPQSLRKWHHPMKRVKTRRVG